MTRDEALQLLGLAPDAALHDVRTAVAAEESDLVERRDKAASDAQRQRYIAKLAALRLAAETLESGPPAISSNLSLTMQGDLPLAVPGMQNTPSAAGQETARFTKLPVALYAGQVVADRYEIGRELGRGGMGVVYAARDRVRGEEVALKVLHPALVSDPQSLERFVNEARLASKLSHPHIGRVFDIGQTAEHTYLTMELLSGRTLRAVQQEQPRFEVAEVVRLAGQLCDALDYAHQQGVIHRDVKPENLWVEPDGTLKVLDFGIARLLKETGREITSRTLGTAYYMAPEQVKGQRADARADQYAVAVVLYELLTGEIPQGACPAPSAIRPAIPAALSAAVMRGMSPAPQARFGSLQDFQSALQSEGTVRRLSSSRWFSRMAVAVVVAAAILAIWLTAHAGLAWKKQQNDAAAQRSEFSRQWGRLEELEKVAVGMGDEIRKARDEARHEVDLWQKKQDEAQKRSETQAQEYAAGRIREAQRELDLRDLLFDAWSRHPDFTTANADWRIKAAGHLGVAKAHAAEDNFALALQELAEADALIAGPGRWRQTAADVIKRRRDLVEQLVLRKQEAHDIPFAAYQFPESLIEQAAPQLIVAYAGTALKLVTQAEAATAEIASLLPLRRTASTSTVPLAPAGKLPALAKDLESLEKSLSTGDDQIARGELASAKENYNSTVVSAQSLRTRLIATAADLLSTGETALDRCDWKKALELFELALTLELEARDRAQAHVGVARVLDGEDALPETRLVPVEAALAADPDCAAALFERGNIHYCRRRYAQAADDLGRAISLVKVDDSRGLSLRALIYDGLADCSENKIETPLTKQGEKSLRQHAEADADAALKLDPKCWRALLVKVWQLRERDDHDGVIAICDKALAEYIANGGLLYARAIAWKSKKDYEKALADYAAALKFHPRNTGLLESRARAYKDRRSTGDLGAAIADYSTALEIDPIEVGALSGRAWALNERGKDGDYELAISDCNRILAIDHNHWSGKSEKGYALHSLKRWDEAINHYTSAIEVDSKSTWFLTRRAEAYIERAGNGDKEKAVADCNRALVIDPESSSAYEMRGRALSLAEEWDAALSDFTNAIKRSPNDANLFHWRGWLWIKKKDYAKALDDLNACINLKPQSRLPYLDRADTYDALGQKDKAEADRTKYEELKAKQNS